MEIGKSGIWTAFLALVAALAATVSTPALADKGGRGRHLGVPSVDLGLSKFHRAGAGPLVAAPGLSVAPGLMREPVGNGGVPSAAAPGASGLTPSSDLTPPGHLATPGLRLGHTQEAMPAAHNPVQPDIGSALGHRTDVVDGTSQGAAQGPAAATDRIAATSRAADRDASHSSEVMPRQLPTCR